MRPSMIELLYVDEVYDRIKLTKAQFRPIPINTLSVMDIMNEFNQIDRTKFLLEQFFLLHYLVFIRGCECSPILGNYRNYLDILINRIDSNKAANATNFEVIKVGQELFRTIRTKKSIIDWTIHELQKLDEVLTYGHDDESTQYQRMVSREAIIPIIRFIKHTDDDAVVDDAQCLIPGTLQQDNKLTIESYNKVDIHKSLSISFRYSSNIQSYDAKLAHEFNYYGIIDSLIPKGHSFPIISISEKEIILPVTFFTGFKLNAVDNVYMLPEAISAISSSIEPYLKSSWVDFIKLYVVNRRNEFHADLHALNAELSNPYNKDQKKMAIYLSLLLAAAIFRSKHGSAITLDNIEFISDLGAALGLIDQPVDPASQDDSKNISSEAYALIEDSPFKQMLHSMVLKYAFLHTSSTLSRHSGKLAYGFLDEDPQEEDEYGEPIPTEYTISEQPVEPLTTDDTQQEEDDPSNDQSNIVDPTENPEEDPNATPEGIEDPTEAPEDNASSVMVDDTSEELQAEDKDEDAGPLFEFIKDKCTLNELFYKRKLANTIQKILELKPKGLVKEQIKSLEYWYRKLLFLVDISSTKKFLKSVLKDYKVKKQQLNQPRVD